MTKVLCLIFYKCYLHFATLRFKFHYKDINFFTLTISYCYRIPAIVNRAPCTFIVGIKERYFKVYIIEYMTMYSEDNNGGRSNLIQ